MKPAIVYLQGAPSGSIGAGVCPALREQHQCKRRDLIPRRIVRVRSRTCLGDFEAGLPQVVGRRAVPIDGSTEEGSPSHSESIGHFEREEFASRTDDESLRPCAEAESSLHARRVGPTQFKHRQIPATPVRATRSGHAAALRAPRLCWSAAETRSTKSRRTPRAVFLTNMRERWHGICLKDRHAHRTVTGTS